MDYSVLSGLATEFGSIRLFIVPKLDFTILNPTPGIYTFGPSQGTIVNGYWTFPVSLNIVTESNVTDWNYTLYNSDYGYYFENNFNPNITMDVRLGSNTLYVWALDEYGNTLVKSVVFTVTVSDSAPIIEINDTEWLACDGQTFEREFNITDLDDAGGLHVLVTPSDPFYGEYLGRLAAGLFFGRVDTNSRTLKQSHVGLHTEFINVYDYYYSDNVTVNITVIDVNKVPVIDDLGAQMVWNNGDDTNFYYIWSADDEGEDGNLSDGVMNLTLDIHLGGNPVNLFNISSDGEINFTANISTPTGIYDVGICVQDTALASLHPNITNVCNESGESNFVCDNFTLTVTDNNREPQILLVDPLIFPITVTAKDIVKFNVTAYDPDYNPIDIEWYVNTGLVERRSLNYSDNKTYTDEIDYLFPCGVYGWITFTVNVTDGSLYDSFTWPIYVNRGDCDTDVEPKGGGGGGGLPGFCIQDWVCPEWGYCWNVESYFKSGMIDVFERNSYMDQCRQLDYNQSECGFQTRECVDINQCTQNVIETEKPGGSEQVCYYVENAGCSDGVKNCHDGACEILVDCGGPCGPCPTCSDNIQNQGEEGVDCGGPCISRCELEEPREFNYAIIFISIGLILLIIFIIYIVYRIIVIFFKKRDEDEEDKKNKNFSPLRGGSRKKRLQTLLIKKGDKNGSV